MYPQKPRPPIVRLAPKTGLEKMLGYTAQASLAFLGFVAFIAVLEFGQALLSPLLLSLVIGLMFGPFADRLERAGMPATVSAASVVISFLVLIVVLVLSFAVPMSDWMSRLPVIWARIQEILADWRGAMETLSSLSEQLRELTGDGNSMKVSVDEGSPAADIAILAPTLIAQVLIFLASLYFFISSRHDIRALALRLCANRRLRWRTARIFRDAEINVSRYLVSITSINIGLGCAVALAMFLLGVPSPLLWGLLAAALNYIIYIGPAMMAMVLVGVGLATYSELPQMLLPAGTYLLLNMMEAQFVTPSLLGLHLTLNPLVVFLSVVFWLWLWGPIGGFVAVPVLLICSIIAEHLLPLVPHGNE